MNTLSSQLTPGSSKSALSLTVCPESKHDAIAGWSPPTFQRSSNISGLQSGPRRRRATKYTSGDVVAKMVAGVLGTFVIRTGTPARSA